jgi:hypothetical protein
MNGIPVEKEKEVQDINAKGGSVCVDSGAQQVKS